MGYPIKRDDIPGIETFVAIKQFQEKENLPVELPTEAEEWLKPMETSDKPKEQKKVSFNLEEPKNERQEVVNLLSKLKPKSVVQNENEIINLLKKVLENQEKILSKLNKEDTEITAMLED